MIKVTLGFIDDEGYPSVWYINTRQEILYPVWMLGMCDEHESKWFWVEKGLNEHESDDFARYDEMTKDL